jgi:hypothetical protein
MKETSTLREAAFHLQYEIGMLFETAHKLENCDDVVLYNALLESYLIHARNLIFFFFEEALRDDDIVASHFVEDWNTIRGWRPPLLRKAGEEANKKVTHLTYRRLDDTYSWDLEAITREISAVVLLFCREVDDHKITKNFKPYVTSLATWGTSDSPSRSGVGET